ncbi:type IV pilin protein [Herbaspirillum sp. RV1423]|uniref:type IV pilin protein n=1 Tax=Herbaspirillum sp. RV1423 TaxID=1443993 RepID=UPI0004B1B34E|nr:type IV pilin protein [Herbaspirillum sp. RV1423]
MTHRQQGFTLIELMIVVCIVGVLALFAYPSYQGHVRKAKRAEARATLMQAMQQQERHFSQHNRYHAYDNAAGAASFRWFSGETAASSAYRISAVACPGDSLQDCVVLSAAPGGESVDANFSDAQCGTLTLNSRGEKTAAGLPQSDAPQACW